MAKDLNKYAQYSLSDFLLDEDFIDWVTQPNEDRNRDWTQISEAFPLQAKNIKRAKRFILRLQITDQEQPKELKEKIWQSIKIRTSNGKVRSIGRRRMWWAAASVLVIVLGSAIVFTFQNKKAGIVANAEQGTGTNDVIPGGNKATLTLSNGKVIYLDSTNSGSIATQGNIKVIKLNDSQIVYRPEGESKLAQVQYNTIKTPRGGQYQLVLADGTSVWLNAASSLRFPSAFTGNERRVEVTGEAYFEVAHNAAKPFYVTVKSPHSYSGTEIKVLGTHFNINAYPDEKMMRTTLLQGAVKVMDKRNEIGLKPGQQARIENNSEKISVAGHVDVSQVIAWKNGYFQFDNFTIGQIMRQISRWYDVEVIYEGPIPTGHYVGKPSRDLNLSQILKVIEYSGVELKIVGNKILVSNE